MILIFPFWRLFNFGGGPVVFFLATGITWTPSLYLHTLNLEKMTKGRSVNCLLQVLLESFLWKMVSTPPFFVIHFSNSCRLGNVVIDDSLNLHDKGSGPVLYTNFGFLVDETLSQPLAKSFTVCTFPTNRFFSLSLRSVHTISCTFGGSGRDESCAIASSFFFTILHVSCSINVNKPVAGCSPRIWRSVLLVCRFSNLRSCFPASTTFCHT